MTATKADRLQIRVGPSEKRLPELDDWLRRYATQNRRPNTAATWVIADAQDAVVAYVSLSMTGIDRSSAPAALAKQAPDPVPALSTGRSRAVASARHSWPTSSRRPSTSTGAPRVAQSS